MKGFGVGGRVGGLGLLVAVAAWSVLLLQWAAPAAGQNCFAVMGPCEDQNTCFECSNRTDCMWCDSSSLCMAANATMPQCDGGWCQSEMCPCPPWPYSSSWFGQLALMAFYGALLAYGAKLIADGSELLLEILHPGIIGGLVLPILGAVPDSAMILVSGAFGSQAEAQQQIDVGMGTLAGSTVMLLTVAWSASLSLARCDIEHGEAQDKKLTKKFDLLHTGITVDRDASLNAIIALVCSAGYLIVQVVAFFYLDDLCSDTAVQVVGYFALGGCIICFVELAVYCVYQIVNPRIQKKRMQRAKEEAILRMTIDRFMSKLQVHTMGSVQEPATETSHLQAASIPDVRSIGLRWKAAAKTKESSLLEEESGLLGSDSDSDTDSVDSLESDDGEVQFDMKIALKSAALMLAGTLLVSIFSDPMVEVIDDFGKTVGIRAFYLSFVITPFCSNASELVSSLVLSSKKLRKNTSLTYAQIYGAAVMNSTMCLGVFYGLVFFRGLAWTFNAETIIIVISVWLICTLGAFKRTFATWWALVIICYYPISILIVAFLESPLIGLT
mmetsp:Transcript_14730/g.57778  ORF Transcript_14730/g.57778 Transcript_14730/m.57778 type:complete len:555 (-) Transcript_14730:34-1698(-)